MAEEIVSFSAAPVASGAYDSFGIAYGPNSQRLTSGFGDPNEIEYDAFDTSGIDAEAADLLKSGGLQVSLNFTTSTSDIVKHTIQVQTLEFSAADQARLEANRDLSVADPVYNSLGNYSSGSALSTTGYSGIPVRAGFGPASPSINNNVAQSVDVSQALQSAVKDGHDLVASFYETSGGFSNSTSVSLTGAGVLFTPPTITGAASGQAVADTATLHPFANVTIADGTGGVSVTGDRSASTTITTIAGIEQLDIRLSSAANGSLSGARLVTLGSGHYQLIAGAADQVTTELRALTFTPTAHEVAPGGTVSTVFTLSDLPLLGGGAVTDSVTSVTATATASAPVITGVPALASGTAGVAFRPLASIGVAEADLASVSATLTVGKPASGTLSGTGVVAAGGGTYVLAAANAATLSSELRSVLFTEAAGTVPPGNFLIDSLSLTVRETGTTQDASAIVFVSTKVAAPTPSSPSFASSTSLVSSIPSGGTTHPFSGVVLTDPGTSAVETLSVVSASGTLAGGGFTRTSAGTYVASGTVAQINADLAAATFTDTFVTSGDLFSRPDYITLRDTGSVGGTASASAATVTDLVNVEADYVPAPVPSHPVFTPSGLVFSLVGSGATIAPFAGATLSDPGTGAVETVTVVAQNGTFSGAGFTQAAAGTFVATGTVAQVNADLAGARFSDTALSPTIHQIKGDQISVTDTGSVGGVASAPARLGVEVDFMTQTVNPSMPVLTDAFSTQQYPAGTDTIVNVFASAELGDAGYQARETLTMVSASGTLSGPGFAALGQGTYVATGSLGQINADLEHVTLTVSGAGTTTVQLTDTGSVLGVASLRAASLTEIVVVAPCFAPGTLIRTEAGDVAVEALRVGERVRLASGGLRPVRWLGHRRVDCRRHPAPEQVRPVRVRAHAFGDNLPARDLVLSPEHALFLDGHLVPVHALIDGASVVQEAWERVTYHHVELDRHDVLLAEGLAAESYLDTGNRAQFGNAPVVALQPDFGRGDVPADPCAPLALAGPVVEAQRARLRAVAAGRGRVAA